MLDPLAVPLSGTNLIEASAGTGKTYTIETLYLRLLLERSLPVNEILVVTYTNAATAELRARIRRRLRGAIEVLDGDGCRGDDTLRLLVERCLERGEESASRQRLIAALHGFDEAAIFTIHGFCQRVLQQHAFESGARFEAELVADQSSLVDEVVRDFIARELYAADEAFARVALAGASLAYLTDLASRAAAHPDIAIVPAAAASTADTASAAWREVHARAAGMWAVGREAILDVLLSSESLHGNPYGSERSLDWGARMDEVLESAAPGALASFKAFKYFTTDELKKKTRRGWATPENSFFDACTALQRAAEDLRAELGRRLLGFKLDFIGYTRREMRRRKEASNTQFFDDLLQRLDEALAGPGGETLARRVRGCFPAVLIDEFQDTDPIQYRIFRRAYHGSEECALFLIGDPKQAIYAFRGADVFAYMKAKEDAGSCAYSLGTNWRSGPSLVEAVNALFERAREPFVFDQIPFSRVRPAPGARNALGGAAAGRAPLRILFAPRAGREGKGGFVNKGEGERDAAAGVAAEVARLLASRTTVEGRPLVPGDIAVLCRTNAQAAAMQNTLRELRVPSVLQGDASVFDAGECGELERVLRAIAEPEDGAAVKAALTTPLMGWSGNELYDLPRDQETWDGWVRYFRDWRDIWVERGFTPAFRRMLDDCSVQRRLLELVDGERRLTNVLHLGELLQTAGRETRRGPLSLVEWLEKMRSRAAARSEFARETAQIRLESDAKAVQVLTVHKSKGLEYPVVFCPFLWAGVLRHKDDRKYVQFHDPAHDHRRTIDLGSADWQAHAELEEREALAESLRLLYVALTRAKHACGVVWGGFRAGQTSALGYLLHQGGDPSGPIAPAVAGRIATLDDEAMLRDLAELARAAPGAIEVVELAREPAPAYEPEREPAEDLRCRDFDRKLELCWRTSSFSALVSSDRGLSGAAEEGLDRDEEQERPESGGDEVPGGEEDRVVLHDFPGGTRAGLMVHEIFERLDFQRSGATEVRDLVGRTLEAYGLEASWTEAMCRAVADVVSTPLGEGALDLKLALVAAERRLNELEFIFPVAAGRGPGEAEATLASAALSRVFAQRGAPPRLAAYAERVGRLGFPPLAGYLRGYIDLAFEHAGRWYLVDYKSNWLGPRPQDYSPSRLEAVMASHHYILQYHLYAVALDRYLELRIPDYEYERHFGGVYYLFVRGMSPGNPRRYGIFYDHPERDRLLSIRQLLEKGTGYF